VRGDCELQRERHQWREPDGAHAVLVYTVLPPEVADAPVKQVAAFRRVLAPAGSTVTEKFTLNVCRSFGIVERTAYKVVPPGRQHRARPERRLVGVLSCQDRLLGLVVT